MKILNNFFEKSTGVTWQIEHKHSGLIESFTNFQRFEKRCKILIANETAKSYKVNYWVGSTLDESCDLDVYFG
jgi:hypothetical protein